MTARLATCALMVPAAATCFRTATTTMPRRSQRQRGRPATTTVIATQVPVASRAQAQRVSASGTDPSLLIIAASCEGAAPCKGPVNHRRERPMQPARLIKSRARRTHMGRYSGFKTEALSCAPRKADGDRLLPARDLPAAAALERASFAPMHRRLHVFRYALRVLRVDVLRAAI